MDEQVHLHRLFSEGEILFLACCRPGGVEVFVHHNDQPLAAKGATLGAAEPRFLGYGSLQGQCPSQGVVRAALVIVGEQSGEPLAEFGERGVPWDDDPFRARRHAGFAQFGMKGRAAAWTGQVQIAG